MKEKEYKLNIDPRILELLGPSLYTNIYYVLAELIANAYDADAHNVYIIANLTRMILPLKMTAKECHMLTAISRNTLMLPRFLEIPMPNL